MTQNKWENKTDGDESISIESGPDRSEIGINNAVSQEHVIRNRPSRLK